jgi:hypothetical protein
MGMGTIIAAMARTGMTIIMVMAPTITIMARIRRAGKAAAGGVPTSRTGQECAGTALARLCPPHKTYNGVNAFPG